MPVRPRDPEKHNMVRKAALELFFEVGLEGFSMQKLAKRARVSPATLYIYYRDRDDLMIRLCVDEMEKMNEAALAGFDPEMSFAIGLETQWKNRARYFMAHPMASHFLEQMRYSAGYYEEALKELKSDFVLSMRKFVKTNIERGELIELPIEIYWSVAFAPLYQLLKMDIHRIGFPTRKPFRLDEKKMKSALALVLKALSP